jgi:hypothetical protein
MNLGIFKYNEQKKKTEKQRKNEEEENVEAVSEDSTVNPNMGSFHTELYGLEFYETLSRASFPPPQTAILYYFKSSFFTHSPSKKTSIIGGKAKTGTRGTSEGGGAEKRTGGFVGARDVNYLLALPRFDDFYSTSSHKVLDINITFVNTENIFLNSLLEIRITLDSIS